MFSKIGAKVIEMILSKLGSFLLSFITEWLADRKDTKDIQDAFNEDGEGDIAAGLNDVFRR